MYTAAGNLLLEIQVIPVRTAAKYLHHLSYNYVQQGKSAGRGVDSSSGYRSTRVTQMSRFRHSHYTGVSSAALVQKKFLLYTDGT